MKLKFSLTYNTAWGESLHVVVDYRGADGVVIRRDMPMTTADGRLWTLEATAYESRQHPIETFTYRYEVKDEGGRTLRREWDMVPRTLHFDSSHDYVMPDTWRDVPLQHHLYTKAYVTTTGGTRDDRQQTLRAPLYRRTILFKVAAPQLVRGEALALCGSHPAVGGWNTSRYIKMSYAGDRQWMLSVNVMSMSLPIEYKYVVIDEAAGSLKQWEEGANRSTGAGGVADGQVLILDGGTLRTKESPWRTAGVALPLFALRSARSYGVGDFGDLVRMIDYAASVGIRMIQLLPVNDTTANHCWTDSCPYNTVSVYALHPQYADLEAAGELSDPDAMTAWHRRRRELNSLPYTDYERVQKVKGAYLSALYDERGALAEAGEDYAAFVRENERWLLPYAVFCSLRDKYGTPRHEDWKECAAYNRDDVMRYAQANARDIRRAYFVQFILHTQLRDAAAHARRKGVALMGDIPVCVARNSVETWATPQFFHLRQQAGLPPDFFSRDGSNWGSPTYNWEVMESDGYNWWKRRLKHIETFFDAVRIDHVIGFFRIWEIPAHAVQGVLGHFAPALPLTPEEIGRFGLPFRKDLLTRPFINDNILGKLFGIHADYVKKHFLTQKAYNLYELKGECDTQRKVERLFEGKNDENSVWIRDGLFKLISDVLFVPDPNNPDTYHPRIDGHNTPLYHALPDNEKEAFMRLYNNFFAIRHNTFWSARGRALLAALLGDTRMTVCAEDIGALPHGTEDVLDELRIFSLEIQSMPKGNDYEFGHLDANPQRSVATTSTHDMPTLRGWWQENRERTQRYYTTMLQKEGKAPDSLPPHIAEEIIGRHLYCPSMMCILPIQDWLAMDTALRPDNARDERINVPADSYNKWKYRMSVSVEDLADDDTFNRKVRTMIKRSKR